MVFQIVFCIALGFGCKGHLVFGAAADAGFGKDGVAVLIHRRGGLPHGIEGIFFPTARRGKITAAGRRIHFIVRCNVIVEIQSVIGP